MLFSIFGFKNFWGSANIILQIPLKMGKHWRRRWVQHNPWSSKILFCFSIEAYFFFSNSHIHNIVSTFSDIEKSTLKMTTLVWRCPIQRWNTQHYFNFVERCKFQRWGTKRFFNVALTLCDVAISYQLKCNGEPTLKCSLGMGLY